MEYAASPDRQYPCLLPDDSDDGEDRGASLGILMEICSNLRLCLCGSDDDADDECEIRTWNREEAESRAMTKESGNEIDVRESIENANLSMTEEKRSVVVWS